MRGKERKRLVVLAEVKQGKLSVAGAGRTMGVCYRQAKRIWHRFKKAGDAGLMHGNRGQAGPRRKTEKLRRQVLARYVERYPDFGPTLAAEKLRQEGMVGDHETLRRWLVAKGLWQGGGKRQQHRAWRERREGFGQRVQLDGSHHDWFEGRREKAVLMVMVDEAANRTGPRFSEQETTRASYDVFDVWVRKTECRGSLYVDRDSIYRCERGATVAEQIAGEEPRTQFGRAMEQLGVELILAHFPQARGRVERRHCLLQDRLYAGRKLRWKELPARPLRVAAPPRKMGPIKLLEPGKEHPWRRDGMGAGKEFWWSEKTRGAAVKRARRLAFAASDKPSLRSGSPPAANA
jgi:hypothetical protein